MLSPIRTIAVWDGQLKMQLALLGIGENQLEKAVQDVWDGLHAWRLWSLFGLNDVKMRYRRSTLGPFWATLSMGIQILVTGFIMTYLFHSPIQRFLPFIAIGLIVWNTLTTIVSDASQAFIGSADLILQVKRPLSVYLFQVIWRNMIIAAHSIVIFFVVAFLFGLYPGGGLRTGDSRCYVIFLERDVDGRYRCHSVYALSRHSNDRDQRLHGFVLADADCL